MQRCCCCGWVSSGLLLSFLLLNATLQLEIVLSHCLISSLMADVGQIQLDVDEKKKSKIVITISIYDHYSTHLHFSCSVFFFCFVELFKYVFTVLTCFFSFFSILYFSVEDAGGPGRPGQSNREAFDARNILKVSEMCLVALDLLAAAKLQTLTSWTHWQRPVASFKAGLKAQPAGRGWCSSAYAV